MIEGRSFLYQGLDRTVYHINEDSVRAIQSWSSGEIVAFVDGDRKSYEPPLMLLNEDVQIILASSPKGASENWTEQAGGVKLYTSQLCALLELFVSVVVLC